jgi:cation diffusion facilitator CzcD-associated flavoprotein CzcO
MPTQHHEVVIVGAGFSGIGLATKLREAGFDDVVLLDEADGVGGTWHWNTYPGVAVDIPSFSYQFSFAPEDWSRTYAPGAELKAYAERLVDRFGLRPLLRLGTRVEAAVFDEDEDLWRLRTDGETDYTARWLLGAVGALTQPKLPEIDGLDSFAGELLHTARWPQDADLRGKRVAVIGTGASAVQLVPAIAGEVAELAVFQRTPIWCLPKADHPLPGPVRRVIGALPPVRFAARAVSQTFVELTFPLAAHYHRRFPLTAGGEKLGRWHLRQQVEDPEVREALTPRYALGCKRPSFSNDYLKTYNLPHVRLETAPIERMTAEGLRTADGRDQPFDVVVLATGFKVFERGAMPPFETRGTGGQELGEVWDAQRFHAYEGVSVPGFPNLFTVLGPYGYNGASYFHLIETQTRHVLRCLRRAREERATRVEVRREATERYTAAMRARKPGSVFADPSCAVANSYYFDPRHGDTPFRHASSLEVTWRSARFSLDDYAFSSAADREPAALENA